MSNPLSVVAAPQPGMGMEPVLVPEGGLPEGQVALGGPSKAAIALVALGAEHAAEVLKHLPEAQAEALSAEIAKMGVVDTDVLNAVVDELAAETGPADAPQGGIGYTRDVLERVVGAERADELIAQFMGGERKPFDFMRSMAAEEVITLLEGEAAQTVALVTVNVRPQLAGAILDGLDSHLQADVALRLAQLQPVEPRVLQDIDTGLREKAAASGATDEKGEAPPSGVEILAQILQGAGRATERQVLGGLESVDPELAEAVRAKMFTFEDLPKLSDKDLQLVLRDIDAKDLTMALRGVSDELMERVISNMSQRAGETLREEMEMQAPVKRAVVEEAQTVVVAAIRALDEAGSIELPSADTGTPGEEPEELL